MLPQDDERRPVYTMQVAAGLLGAHPQTLRNYERAGLVQPERSEGNQRLYSPADIARLEQLLELVDRFGLTMESLHLVEQLHSGLERLAAVLAGEPTEASWTESRTIVDALRQQLAPLPTAEGRRSLSPGGRRSSAAGRHSGRESIRASQRLGS